MRAYNEGDAVRPARESGRRTTRKRIQFRGYKAGMKSSGRESKSSMTGPRKMVTPAQSWAVVPARA